LENRFILPNGVSKQRQISLHSAFTRRDIKVEGMGFEPMTTCV
jgi:hypothetical protein